MSIVKKSGQQYFGFDPRSLSGCQLWLDGADPSGNGTLPANNSALSTWVDKSGSGNSGTAIGTTPLYQSNSGVLFSTGGYSTSYSASLANESMFFVYTPTSVPDTITLAGPNDVGGRTITVNTNLRLESSSYFVAFGSVTSNSTVTLNQRCQSGYINTASSMIVTHNGITYSPVSLSYTAGRTTRIGISGTNNAIPFKGTIHEVLAYNIALTSSQRQQVEGYLAWKWAIQTNLPVSHPYRSISNFQRIPQAPDFGSLLFWWDSSDYSTFTPSNPTTGTSITGWRDKISNITLTNVNSSPTWQTNGVLFTNPSSNMSASTQNLAYQNDSSPYTLTQNFTVFVAHSPNLSSGIRLPFSILANRLLSGSPAFTAWIQCGVSEGNVVGALSNGSWVSLQQSSYFATTLGQPRIDSALSASTNFIWTNGTENIYGLNNIGRGNTLAGSATIGLITMSSLSTSLGNRAYDGTIHEVLVYNTNLTTSQIRCVEGYLAWKWNIYNNLASGHPFKTIPTSSPIFVPTSLSGVQLWLDADDSSTITFASGSNISQWSDKSGNNYHATQTIAGRYPTYDSTNKRVNFTRTVNNYFLLPNNALPTGNSAYTYYIVLCFTTVAEAMGVIGGGTWGTNNGVFALRSFDTTNARLITYWWNNDLFTPINTYSANVPLMIMTDWSGTTRTIVKNGTQIATNNPGTARNQGSANNAIGSTNNLSEYMEGYMNEIIVFNRALTSNENRQVEGYLAWKWGMQNSLPTTHPYYKFRP